MKSQFFVKLKQLFLRDRISYYLRRIIILLPFITLIIGLVLRVIFPGSYPLRFDQVQILEAVDQIHSGKLLLIGPRTGPAQMFTGPLIYYAVSFLSLFFSPLISLVMFSACASLVTGVTLYWSLSRIENKKFGLIGLMIWAFSPFILFFDRVPWNPSLMILASELIYFSLYRVIQKPNLINRHLIWLLIGVFLGYQAHFSGLLLIVFPLMVSILLVSHWKKKMMLSVFSLMAFCLSLLPTFVFDLRNHFLNFKGLLALVNDKEKVSIYQILLRFVDTLRVAIETAGKLLFNGSAYQLLIVSGGFIVVYGLWILYKQKSDHSLFWLSFSWLITVVGSFSLYRGSTPEYYFFILVPIFIYLASLIIDSFIKQQTHLLFLFGLAFCMALIYVVRLSANSSGFAFGQQLEMINALLSLQQSQPIKQLIVDIQPVDAIGFEYLLKKNNFTLSDDGSIVHAIYPINNNFISFKIGADAALWIDPRNHPESSYISFDEYLLVYQGQCEALSIRESSKWCSESERGILFFREKQELIGKICLDHKLPLIRSKEVYSNQVTSCFESIRFIQPSLPIIPTHDSH